jgi:hypothetical protein
VLDFEVFAESFMLGGHLAGSLAENVKKPYLGYKLFVVAIVW